MSAIRLVGRAATPRPSLVVNLRLFSTGCAIETNCGATVSNAAQQGQGHHGGFGRAESFNFMAAVGPSFKSGFVDTMPVGNVDVHPTIARLMGLPREAGGTLRGRVLEEALVDGRTSRVTVKTLRSKPGPSRSSHRAALSGGRGRALLRRCRVSRPLRWFAGRSVARRRFVAAASPSARP